MHHIFSCTFVAHLYYVPDSRDIKMNDLRHNSCPWELTYIKIQHIYQQVFCTCCSIALWLNSSCFHLLESHQWVQIWFLFPIMVIIVICNSLTAANNYCYQRNSRGQFIFRLFSSSGVLFFLFWELTEPECRQCQSGLRRNLRRKHFYLVLGTAAGPAMAPVKISHVVSFSSQVY